MINGGSKKLVDLNLLVKKTTSSEFLHMEARHYAQTTQMNTLLLRDLYDCHLTQLYRLGLSDNKDSLNTSSKIGVSTFI